MSNALFGSSASTKAPKKKLTSSEILKSFLGFVVQLCIFVYDRFILIIRYIGKYYWQHKFRFCSDIVLILLLAAISITGINEYKLRVSEKLISDIDAHSSFKRNFSQSVSSGDSREFMNVGAPGWLRRTAIGNILNEAKKVNFSNVETAVLLAIADRESGFNPLAKAKSTTACGVNQFIKETGSHYGLKDASCFNPSQNTHAQVKHFTQIINQPKVRAVLRDKTEQEQLVFMFREAYCRHHDGINMKVCSETAQAMTAKSLPMLFGAYNVLNAENTQSANIHFLYAVYDTLKKMRFWATSQINLNPKNF